MAFVLRVWTSCVMFGTGVGEASECMKFFQFRCACCSVASMIMASDVELIATNERHRLANDIDESIFEGFSRPAPVSTSQARKILMRCGLDGKLILWEDVQRMLEMSQSALHSKTEAITNLRDQLQQAQEQLLCEQQAYAKIVQEEEALEADSGWLRHHIQGLLAEKGALVEQVERLKTYVLIDSPPANNVPIGRIYFSCRNVTCYSSSSKATTTKRVPPTPSPLRLPASSRANMQPRRRCTTPTPPCSGRCSDCRTSWQRSRHSTQSVRDNCWRACRKPRARTMRPCSSSARRRSSTHQCDRCTQRGLRHVSNCITIACQGLCGRGGGYAAAPFVAWRRTVVTVWLTAVVYLYL